MKKKSLIPICIIIAVFAFSTCDIPNMIEVRGKPGISIPMDIKGSDLLGDDFFDKLLEDLDDIDGEIKVMKYTGYKLNNVEIQAYLLQLMTDIKLDMEELGDFNLDGFDIPLDIADIDLSIPLIDFNEMSDGLDPISISVSFDENIDDIKESIQDGLAGTMPDKQPFVVGSPVALPFNQNIKFGPMAIGEFDDITFASGMYGGNSIEGGTISVKLKIDHNNTVPGNAPSGVTGTTDLTGVSITFSNVDISDKINPTIQGYSGSIRNITLDSSNPEGEIIFDLTGKTLSMAANGIEISIGGYADNSSTSGLKVISISVSSVEINDPKIQGISGFDMKAITFPISGKEIDFDLADSGFIHAIIAAEGNSNIKFNLPAVPQSGKVDYTWFSVADINTDINIAQAAYNGQISYNSGNAWTGLSLAITNINTSVSLGNKEINPNHIGVDGSVTIPAQKARFWLSLEDVNNGEMTLNITPSLKIEKFSEIHVDIGDFGDIPQPEPFVLGDSGEYIESIKFHEIGVIIDFEKADIDGLEISIKVKDPDDPAVYLVNAKGPVTTGAPVTITDKGENNAGIIFNVDKNPDYQLDFEIELLLNNTPLTGGVIKLVNFETNKSTLEIKVADEGIDTVFDWEAKVDLTSVAGDALKGSFPEAGEDPFNLKEDFGNYLDNFTFDDVKAYLYINIPEHLSGFTPKVKITAKDGTAPIELFKSNTPGLDSGSGMLSIVNAGFSDLDPDDSKEYAFTKPLPTNGRVELLVANILNAMPEDLKLEYEVELAGVDITPAMLDGLGGASLLTLNAVVIIPLALTAGSGGAVLKVPDLFAADKDFLERESAGESFLPDLGENAEIKINKLSLKINVSNVFDGGMLYMRRAGETPDNAKLRFPLTGSTINIDVDQALLDYIDANYPYYIEEVGIKINGGKKLTIPPDLKISIDVIADFAATFPLEF